MLSGARGKNGRRKPSEMKWCSHCMKSVDIDYVIRTECTFWSCADCGKILGSVCMIGGAKNENSRGPEEPRRKPKKNIVRTTESSSTEGDGADNIRLKGSVKKRRLKGGQKNHVEND